MGKWGQDGVVLDVPTALGRQRWWFVPWPGLVVALLVFWLAVGPAPDVDPLTMAQLEHCDPTSRRCLYIDDQRLRHAPRSEEDFWALRVRAIGFDRASREPPEQRVLGTTPIEWLEGLGVLEAEAQRESDLRWWDGVGAAVLIALASGIGTVMAAVLAAGGVPASQEVALGLGEVRIGRRRFARADVEALSLEGGRLVVVSRGERVRSMRLVVGPDLEAAVRAWGELEAREPGEAPVALRRLVEER
ncbi:MAG: hypothetical protein H6737_26255 [Alphaproteobacteria bacterium]|nr:hypothetical protein [Alphaproteobacteria bacterium]